MICQTGSQFIVMLCDLLEGNVSVCAEYWPRSSGQRMEFGTVEVKNSKVTEVKFQHFFDLMQISNFVK